MSFAIFYWLLAIPSDNYKRESYLTECHDDNNNICTFVSLDAWAVGADGGMGGWGAVRLGLLGISTFLLDPKKKKKKLTCHDQINFFFFIYLSWHFFFKIKIWCGMPRHKFFILEKDS